MFRVNLESLDISIQQFNGDLSSSTPMLEVNSVHLIRPFISITLRMETKQEVSLHMTMLKQVFHQSSALN